MKDLTQIIVVICCAICALTTSCRKRIVDTTCTSKLHGFTGPNSIIGSDVPFPCTHIIISPSGGIIATSTSFMGLMRFSERGSYNTSDNCYYSIINASVPHATNGILNKIDVAGAVSPLVPADSLIYGAVIYNRVNNKLYCITSAGSLGELTVGVTSYSVTPVATSSYLPTSNITVDATTGDMYLQTVDTSVYSNYLEKYHPGASSTTMVASIPYIHEMRFNKNDHMLYGMQRTGTAMGGNFVRINPATGAVSTVSTGLVLNDDYMSGTFDPCTNRYIYSALLPMVTGEGYILYQVDMSGAIVRHDTTATFYQGLDVEY